MRILIIVTKGEIGGAQISVLDLAKGLKERGVEVTVGFGGGDFLKEKLEETKIPYHLFNSLRRTKNPLKNLFFIFELKKFLDRSKFDIVHFNSSNALLGAIGAKLSKSKPRTVFTFRGLSVLDPNYETFWILKYIYRIIFQFFLRFVDKKAFVSKANLEYAKRKGWIKNLPAQAGGTVIYNGLDLKDSDFLAKNEARKFLLGRGVSKDLEDRFVIGSIGRLAYPKNYEFLIRVFPDIIKLKPDAVGIIIGEGPERSKYESLIKEYGLENNIFLAGEVKDAYRLLKAFDLFVLPSKYEGLSVTLIESLFAGLPVLSANVGGNPEILENAGWLYNLDDQKDFREKTKKLMTDEKLRKELAEMSFLKSKDFSLDKTVKGYLDVYKQNN